MPIILPINHCFTFAFFTLFLQKKPPLLTFCFLVCDNLKLFKVFDFFIIILVCQFTYSV